MGNWDWTLWRQFLRPCEEPLVPLAPVVRETWPDVTRRPRTAKPVGFCPNRSRATQRPRSKVRAGPDGFSRPRWPRGRARLLKVVREKSSAEEAPEQPGWPECKNCRKSRHARPSKVPPPHRGRIGPPPPTVEVTPDRPAPRFADQQTAPRGPGASKRIAVRAVPSSARGPKTTLEPPFPREPGAGKSSVLLQPR